MILASGKALIIKPIHLKFIGNLSIMYVLLDNFIKKICLIYYRKTIVNEYIGFFEKYMKSGNFFFTKISFCCIFKNFLRKFNCFDEIEKFFLFFILLLRISSTFFKSNFDLNVFDLMTLLITDKFVFRHYRIKKSAPVVFSIVSIVKSIEFSITGPEVANRMCLFLVLDIFCIPS